MKEKIKKICRIMILVGILLPIFSFAQNTSSVPAQIQLTKNDTISQLNETDKIFTVYQVTNDSINRLLGMLTVIVTIFAAFITGLVLFFAVKQIFADKEIKEYKDTIKQSKISIEKETKEQLGNWKGTTKWIEDKKQEMEKTIQQMKEEGSESAKKDEVEKLVKDFEELKKATNELKSQIDFQKGRISTSVSDIMSSSVVRSPSNWLTNSAIRVGDYGVGCYGAGDYGGPCCSKCFHLNSPGSKFCSDCGEPLI